MEMFLILVFASVTVGTISLLLLAAVAGRAPDQQMEERMKIPQALGPSRFFVTDGSQPAASGPPIPLDVLVSRIERHVRLEQAAMEAFLEAPNAQSLHSRTTSPLVN